jgi:hypothetical protein
MFKMQPTFTVDVPLSSKDAIARIRRVIESAEFQMLADSAGPCVDYRIATEDQRFWSPHLSVYLSDQETGTQIFGRFSPRPEIWTMFMAIYAVAAGCGFVAAIYGYCQWFMGQSPWALLLVPVCLSIIVLLHIGSLFGQSLSADQMQLLRERFDRTIDLALSNDLNPTSPGA